MTAEILQGPGPKGGGGDPWPDLDEETDIRVYCGALFIDLRGSSQMPGGAGLVADRARDFLNSARQIWQQLQEEAAAPPPKSVRLVGDGLFCVWEAGADADILSLPKHVLTLFEKLPEDLKNRWRLPERVKVGMGLAFGEAARRMVADVADYYGYTINLASKLQNLARPQGLVIGPPEFGTLDAAFVAEMIESERLFERIYPLPMAPNGNVRCLVTSHVDEVHEWTCLAWPGFAMNRSEEDGNRLGLNTRGITVLTHEGLRGKIDTLRIWPRNGYDQAEADQFQFIIDDFDNLDTMQENKIVSLAPHRPREMQPQIAGALQLAENFSFIPIRCGLNAIAWHKTRGKVVEDHQSYRETIEYARDNPSFALGLYDNIGASLPVLINAYCPRLGEVFDHQNEDYIDLVIMELEKAQEITSTISKGHRLFRLEGEIETLSRKLNSAKIHAVLGGGAWLADPKAGEQKISTHIPPQSKGFLWMEGAALLNNIGGARNNLYAFLQNSVLKDTYQASLMKGLPYCTCPVTTSLIEKIIRMDEALSAEITSATEMIFEETRRIFEDSGTLSDNVLEREGPALSEKWESAWESIKDKFCQT